MHNLTPYPETQILYGREDFALCYKWVKLQGK